MYVKRENTTRPVRKNEIKELKVFLKGKTFKMTYNVESLKEILNSGIFGKIQIPVYVHNSTLFGENKKGLTIVGSIVSYNNEEETMKVNIFSKFISKVNNIENAIVYPRVSAIYDKSKEENEVKDENAIVENIKVLGFDIASEDFYNI